MNRSNLLSFGVALAVTVTVGVTIQREFQQQLATAQAHGQDIDYVCGGACGFAPTTNVAGALLIVLAAGVVLAALQRFPSEE